MKTPAKKDASLQRIADELKQLKLADVRLVEGHCKLSKLRGAELPTNAHQNLSLAIKIEERERVISVLAAYQLGVTYNPTDAFSEDSTIIVRAKFLVTYKHAEGAKPESLLSSIRPTAVMNTWAFWREYVQSSTVRMGLPAFPVPLVNLSNLVKKERRGDAGPSKQTKAKRKTR